MKTIIISGINIRTAGTLSIYKSLLDEIVKKKLYMEYTFIIMVSKYDMFQEYSEYVEIKEFPLESKSWFLRLYYEYFWFNAFSKNQDIDMWLSLNDKTPKVQAKKQYVYCHNSTMFYKCSWKDVLFSPTLLAYTKLYKFVFEKNIALNTAVILQQNWIADYFIENFPIRDAYVMRPKVDYVGRENVKKTENKDYNFIFPAVPRSYKNFEAIFQADRFLSNMGVDKYKIYVTFKGNENRYARYLFKRYYSKNIIYTGYLEKSNLAELYDEMDCLLFPSKLETWGLPLSEFRELGKNIIAIDLPYARETLEGYNKVEYFKVDCIEDLVEKMKKAMRGDVFNCEIMGKKSQYKRIDCWADLFGEIISDTNN